MTETKRHKKKLPTLRKNKRSIAGKETKLIPHNIHYFSSYQFSSGVKKALSFELDQHVPTVYNRNKLFAESDVLANILKNISHLNDDFITRLKTKLQQTYDKYSRIKVPYKYRTTINNLLNNKQLTILKQGKGRGVVLLDKKRYVEWFLSIISRS